MDNIVYLGSYNVYYDLFADTVLQIGLIKAMSLATDFLLISFLPFHSSNKSLTLVVSLNFSPFTCLLTLSSYFTSSFLASFLYSLLLHPLRVSSVSTFVKCLLPITFLSKKTFGFSLCINSPVSTFS